MKTLTFIFVGFVIGSPALAVAERVTVFRGDDSTASTGNWGLATTNTAGVRFNGQIVPIGHTFSDTDAVPAASYLGMWEDTENSKEHGPLYNGIIYARTIPQAAGKFIGYASKSQPKEGGVLLRVTKNCTNYADEGVVVDPSVKEPFLSCQQVKDLGWITK